MNDDDAFVERTFVANGVELRCRFYRPVFEGQDFRCRYEIDWLDGPRSLEVYGVDGIQAMLLAMQIAHSDLLLRRERSGVDVRWLDGTDLGLPPIDANTAASRN